MWYEDNGTRGMRLAKYLSNAGVASRRRCEELIAEGRVSVNGETVTTPVCLVHPGKDEVRFEGRVVSRDELCYIVFNKPAGFTCSAQDPHARRLIYELLPESMRTLRYVGRLDRDTEGLLILTNDGELLQGLTHPSHEVEKHYVADCEGKLSENARKAMLSGVEDEGETLRARSVRVRRSQGDRSLLEIVLTEGRKREVRRLCAASGLKVRRLARISIGTLQLGDLPSGEWRKMTSEELDSLRRLII